MIPKGVWSVWAISKSSGNALDFIIRSRSSVVSRLSLARLLSPLDTLVERGSIVPTDSETKLELDEVSAQEFLVRAVLAGLRLGVLA